MADMIGRYAQLEYAADIMRARGQRVDPRIVQEMQRIETAAKARLSPAQLHDAMLHKEHAKLRIQQDHAARNAEHVTRLATQRADQAARQLTGGVMGRLNGLTRAEVAAAAAGKTPKSDRPRTLTQSERDAAFRDRTRALDPTGKGWTEREWERRMDSLADADPAAFARLSKSYRADAGQLAAAASKWKNERIEYGLQRRRSERTESTPDDSTPRALTDADRRRAVIVDSYLDSAGAEAEEELRTKGTSTKLDDVRGAIPESQLAESGRRGDVARAFVAVEGNE